MRLLKLVGIIAGLLAGIVVLAVLAVNLVPANHYKGLISTVAKSATGRDLVIGDLDVRLDTRLRVAARDVSLSNATWGSRPQMFTGRLIETEVRLARLLDGVLDLRLILEAPDMLLEKDAAGRANWQFRAGESEKATATPEPAEQTGLSLRPLLREIRLEDLKLSYTDAEAGREHTADFETILLRSLGSQLDVKADGQVDDHPLVVAGGIDEAAVVDATEPGDFSLTGKLGDIALNVKGALDTAFPSPRVDLRLEAGIPSLATLSAFAGRQLPDQGPLNASVRLSGAEGAYSAEDLKIDLAGELLSASVAGAVSDLLAMHGVDLTVSAQTDRLAELVKQLGLEVPTELPPSIGIAGKVSGGLDKLGLSDLDVQVKDAGVEASLEGQVADLLALTGIEADLTLAAQSLATLSKYAGAALPDSGTVELAGKLASPQGLAAPSEVAATLSAEGVVAKLGGNVENLQAAEGIALNVEVKGDSLEQVAKLAGQHFPSSEPLAVETKLSLGAAAYKAEALRIGIGENEITGALAFTNPAQEGARPMLQGNLAIGTLDLAALLSTDDAEPAVSAPAPESKPEATAADSAEDSAKVFPSDPLPLEAFRAFDVDVDITANALGTRTLLLEQLDSRLTMRTGVLKLEPATARVGQGSFTANAEFDASSSPAALTVFIDLDNGTSRHFGGRYNFDVTLNGKGESIAQLMAGLDGQVILDVRELDLEESLLTNFGQSLLSTINPFEEESETTRLVCAVARFDINDGIADAEDKIVAQLTKVTWFGGGTVNLKTEALDLGAQSKPRTGLGVDLTVGLAGLVHVGGTLADPLIVPDPKGVAKLYGDKYLTVATGGLYLLAKGLWDKEKANADVCTQVLEYEEDSEEATGDGEVDSAQPAAGVPPGAEQKNQKAAEPAQPSVLDVLD